MMSASVTGPTEESFLKDVEKHGLTVLMDNGIYRHLRCKQPHSGNMWFDIVTWPGYLAYSGDMGCFVFSRLSDMFEFFRTDRRDNSLGINRSYWGEKLQAVERGHRRFSADKFRDRVEKQVKTWIEEFPDWNLTEDELAKAKTAFEVELREAIQDDVYSCNDEEDEQGLRKALHDFSFTPEDKRLERNPQRYEFQDTWEWDFEDYTYRFTWCCYAIAWTILKYDGLKTK